MDTVSNTCVEKFSKTTQRGPFQNGKNSSSIYLDYRVSALIPSKCKFDVVKLPGMGGVASLSIGEARRGNPAGLD